MTDYTPTTPQIKGSYVQLHSGTSWVSKGLRRAEFDRWLDEIRAEAWDEGHNAGQHNEHEYRPGRVMANPYRQEDQ